MKGFDYKCMVGSDGYGVFIYHFCSNDKVRVHDTRGLKEGMSRKSSCTLKYSPRRDDFYFIHCKQRYYLSEFMRI